MTPQVVGGITNPDFEANEATATPTGWSTTGTAAASYTQAGGYTGKYNLAHYSASAYTVYTYQTITGLANGTYTLSPGVGWELGQPNVVSNSTIFDFNGNALPAMKAFLYNN